MMEPTGPVDHHTGFLCKNEISRINTTARGQLTKIIQPLKPGVIKILVNLENRMQSGVLSGLGIVLHTAILLNSLAGQRVDPGLKVPNVVRMVEGLELLGGGLLEVVDVQVFVQAVRVDQRVGHFDALGFHRVFFGELVFSDLLVVQVGDLVLHGLKGVGC